MTSAIVDTLFPQTPDHAGNASSASQTHTTFKPIPWLRVIAGLTAMSFEGRYVRHGDEIRIIVCFKTHATERYDRDGKLYGTEEPQKTGLRLHRVYSAKDLAECSDPRLPVMNQIRQVAEHEILESLQVIDGSGSRQPFWRRELDGLHGDNTAKAELLESRLPADAIMVARQERTSSVDPLEHYFREWARQSQAPQHVETREDLERRYGVLAKPLDIVEKPTIEETAKILATIVKQRATLTGAERPTIIPVFPDDLFRKVNVSEPGITSTTLAEHVRKYHAGNRRRSWEVSTQARAYAPIDDMSTRLP